jgi:hypothetical protein
MKEASAFTDSTNDEMKTKSVDLLTNQPSPSFGKLHLVPRDRKNDENRSTWNGFRR